MPPDERTLENLLFNLLKSGALNLDEGTKAVLRAPCGVVSDRGLPDGMEPHEPNCRHFDPASPEYGDDEFIITQLPPATAAEASTVCMVSGRMARIIVNTPDIGTAVPRPTPSTYCIKEAPGKGLGMYATRDIRAGELIVAERPLLIVPVSMYARRPYPSTVTKEQGLQVMMADTEREYEVMLEKMAPANRAAYMALANSHRFDGSGPILGVIRTNGFGDECMVDSGLGLSNETGGFSIICNDMSRMNHDCAHNTTRYFDMPSFSMQARAIRDIKIGDEITTNYCHTLEPFATRHEILARYDVKCTCALCTNPSESDPLLAQCDIVHGRAPPNFEKRNRAWFTDFSVPNSTDVKPLLSDLVAHIKTGQEASGGYAFTLFELMKTYAARGDIKNTRAYARKYAVWQLATNGKVITDQQIESAFGMTAVAEVVLRLRGKTKAKMANRTVKASK
ncbi:hypothetical protein EIP91_000327 [Steccherinum ochraceum]|uniref:SET domain-containing protein n=1 Tax=Steccherinum ochraceum TaxID=92696 RepID=A0A4R0RFX1_9APHY|nr:hypothetical protein EIP91_000327 [Steccherinum ochraceum]